MTTQHERIAAHLETTGVFAFRGIAGTPSLAVLDNGQPVPPDGFADPTGDTLYTPGEIFDEGVEFLGRRGNTVSVMVNEVGTLEDFAQRIRSMITAELS